MSRIFTLAALVVLGGCVREEAAPAATPRERARGGDAGRLRDAQSFAPEPDQAVLRDAAALDGATDLGQARDGSLAAGDLAPPALDQGPPAPDQGPPAPDQAPPAPDQAPPAPDQAPPAPDQAPPGLDQGPPAPDLAPPAADQAPPAPDQAPPAPDQAPPAPDQGPPEAPLLAGSWRWQVAQPFSEEEPVFDSLVAWLAAPDGRLAGLSIDRYGIATLRGTYDAAGVFQVIKAYVVGPSAEGEGEGRFLYVGQAAPGPPRQVLGGRWGLPEVEPVFEWGGSAGDRVAVEAVAGRWVIEADFGDGDAALIVSAEGQIGGSITDAVGEATVDGVLDRATGALWFRKAYLGRDLDWWYTGRVDGARIVAGEYAPEADGLPVGVWSARRP